VSFHAGSGAVARISPRSLRPRSRESCHLCTGGIELAESGRIGSARGANRGCGKPGQQISGEFNVKRHVSDMTKAELISSPPAVTPHRRVRPKTVTQTGLAECLVASATTTLRKTQEAARCGAKMGIPIGKPGSSAENAQSAGRDPRDRARGAGRRFCRSVTNLGLSYRSAKIVLW